MALLYKSTQVQLEELLYEIESGLLALPDLQRPFVWTGIRVKELLTSMIKGYPIGFIIEWNYGGNDIGFKQIGTDKTYKQPSKLIIDGQQRLTSLWSLFKSKEVISSDLSKRRIVISYNPLKEIFSTSTLRASSSEWIRDISPVFLSGESYKIEENYINKFREFKLKETKTDITEEEKTKIHVGFDKLKSLKNYPFPILTIGPDASLDEVSNIFVAINSKGVRLTTSDFILTLVSIFSMDFRKKIEKFHESVTLGNQGQFIVLKKFEVSDILDVVMNVAFRRAELRYCYKMLRGVDLARKGSKKNDEFEDEELKKKNFDRFAKTLDLVTDMRNWQDFLLCLMNAGFISSDLLKTRSNISFSYSLYLIGKFDYNISTAVLRTTIAKWFFFISLTDFLSSGDAKIERILINDLRDVKNEQEFVNYIDLSIRNNLSDDFFENNLIFNTGKGLWSAGTVRNSAWICYCASLNVLNAKVLFSKTNLSVSQMFTECSRGMRKSLEIHHLFPKAYLKKQGLGIHEMVNQIANLAFIESTENTKISDKSPADYFPSRKKEMDEDQLKALKKYHALPDNWENMPYKDFLIERRKLMAKVIKAGYERIMNS